MNWQCKIVQAQFEFGWLISMLVKCKSIHAQIEIEVERENETNQDSGG